MRRVELLRAELTCKDRLYSCSIDIEGARELLERREYVGVYVSRIGGAVTGGWGGWVGGVGLKGKIETG